MPGSVTRDKGRGTRNLRMLVFGWLLFLVASSVTAAGIAPDGSFDNMNCIGCHEKRDNELVKAWRVSAHGKDKSVADCVACHGNSHDGATVKARQDETCIACHGGQKNPVVHSYANSKHGLILKLERKTWNWTRPLAQANYRTPGCAYCHMHAAEHNVSAMVRNADLLQKDSKEMESIKDATRQVCQDCHAPRYISRLFDNGEKMLEIARMKVREARDLLSQARKQYTREELKPAEERYQEMRSVHLKNVYLGIAHQSPDYQWWYGQPALDGDLLRIKGAISELIRIKNASLAQQTQCAQ
ncbi:hypothetical protein MNBD_GAMMA24-375 [hydrothermal vent metagenome]|uniref:Uncharacterized protein n=1 Tax=hydrothermal vent metagenome TaxID=652676 RepID=A0A3B1B6P3_9ZZZZ